MICTEITSAAGSFLVANTARERLLPSGSGMRNDCFGLGISYRFDMSSARLFKFYVISVFAKSLVLVIMLMAYSCQS